MAENSKIEWTTHTFNPWIGCTKVSPGCDFCYAEARMDYRLHAVQWGPHGERKRTTPTYWKQPLLWNRKAHDAGERHRVFCASLADVFDNQVPVEWRADLWHLIKATPNLDWLLLTKRPQNIAKMLPPGWGDGWPNVWLGTSVENQTEADRRIPHLLCVPAAVRFLSMEPLLGPVDLTWIEEPDDEKDGVIDALLGCNWIDGGGRGVVYRPSRPGHEGREMTRYMCSSNEEILANRKLDWIIVGGESGPGARPMHPDWPRSIRDQCAAAGVPFFFKQWGEWISAEEGLATISAHGAKFFDFGWRQVIPGTAMTDGQVYGLIDATGREPSDMRVLHGSRMIRVGKKAAGRLLDGIEHNGIPVIGGAK